ncbi:MAG: GNAT family N-acetyltransferase [Acidobacteriia bacterium]|nr:GNAT family N-acetyltransferase [Terriglobia bacterium]
MPPPGVEIVTPRLWLRRWRTEDLEPFAALNTDPEVMEHFPSTLSREETAAAVGWIEKHFERHGFGLWAVDVPGHTRFSGFIGLAVPTFETSFTPCIEIGWRLARPWWGQGFATEGARAALAYGFERLDLPEIVSFTVPGNVRSRRVMEKLGMRYSEDFAHPRIDPLHPLSRHVLYRLSRAEWASGRP